MNESCCIWMHIDKWKLPVQNDILPWKWVLSRTYEPCRTWMSHFTCEWFISHVNATCHVWMHTNEWKLPLLNHIAPYDSKERWIDDTKEKKRRGIMPQTRCAEPCLACGSLMARGTPLLCLLTDYNTLQHTTTRCNTLQHTATCCNTYLLWQGVLRTHCNTLQPISACCPPKKQIDAMKPKNKSMIGKERNKVAHEMCLSSVFPVGPWWDGCLW